MWESPLRVLIRQAGDGPFQNLLRMQSPKSGGGRCSWDPSNQPRIPSSALPCLAAVGQQVLNLQHFVRTRGASKLALRARIWAKQVVKSAEPASRPQGTVLAMSKVDHGYTSAYPLRLPENCMSVQNGTVAARGPVCESLKPTRRHERHRRNGVGAVNEQAKSIVVRGVKATRSDGEARS